MKKWYKPAFKAILKFFYFIIGLVYFIIYFISYLVSVIARVILGLSYFGMGESRKAKDIFRFMFTRAPWDK